MATGALVLCACVLAPRPVRALSERDVHFARYLIHDLRYFDTAERLLVKLKGEATGKDSTCEIAYLTADILKLKGKSKEYEAELDRLRQHCPDHARSSFNSLEKINIEMNKVNKLFELANAAGNAEEAQARRKQGRQLFHEAVEEPLDRFIKHSETELAELAKKPKGPQTEAYQRVRVRRNLSEQVRVRLYLNFAKLLPAENEEYAAERRKYLRRGLKLAAIFVEDRAEFYRMQYDVQLLKGRFELELGRFTEAYEDLSLVIDLEPQGKITSATAVWFKNLHLNGVLFGARAANRAGLHEEAASLVQRRILTAHPTLDLTRADREPSLEKFYVLAILERAIGLAGAGQEKEGLELILDVIHKYSSEPGGETRITDARRALGSLAALGSFSLQGEHYFEAGIGLQSELRFDEALVLFQKGLGALRGAEETARVAPMCLNKIGEINWLKERYAEAAIGWLEICRNYGNHALATKAARNALAATDKLRRQNRQHNGYALLDEEAKTFYDKLGGSSIAIHQKTMGEAHEAQRQGQFARAIELYESIPRFLTSDDGSASKKNRKRKNGKAANKKEPIPFYWTAQARIRVCRYQMWKASSDHKVEDAVALAVDLENVRALALEAGSVKGATEASFSAGQIYLEIEHWQETHATLRRFLNEYKQDQIFRAAALNYLIEASRRIGEGEVAEKAFEILRTEFPDRDATFLAASPMLQYALSQLEGNDASKKAAAYAKSYAEHRTGREELRRDCVRRLTIIDILLEGGDFRTADKLLKDTEEEAKTDADLRKRLLFRQAVSGFNQKKYAAVVKALDEYIAKFTPDGSGPDDPAIYRYQGESMVQIYKQTESLEDLKKAAENYTQAVAYISSLVDVDKSGKANRDYWQWSLRWCQLQRLLGRAEDDEAWKRINRFVGNREYEDMGGPKKKALFLRIWQEAKKNL